VLAGCDNLIPIPQVEVNPMSSTDISGGSVANLTEQPEGAENPRPAAAAGAVSYRAPRVFALATAQQLLQGRRFGRRRDGRGWRWSR
jgi:hypothetical protein